MADMATDIEAMERPPPASKAAGTAIHASLPASITLNRSRTPLHRSSRVSLSGLNTKTWPSAMAHFTVAHYDNPFA